MRSSTISACDGSLQSRTSVPSASNQRQPSHVLSSTFLFPALAANPSASVRAPAAASRPRACGCDWPRAAEEKVGDDGVEEVVGRHGAGYAAAAADDGEDRHPANEPRQGGAQGVGGARRHRASQGRCHPRRHLRLLFACLSSDLFRNLLRHLNHTHSSHEPTPPMIHSRSSTSCRIAEASAFFF